ncbi:MAG: ABC transporter substrate-binding protein [Gemmataceae bacterium]
MLRLVFILVFGILLSGCRPSSPAITLYSAQDEEVAAPIVEHYQKTTGQRVSAKYDTEANKSVGLVTELLTEKVRPRCDLHWNNEILGTIRLANAGVYAALPPKDAQHFPEWTRGPKGYWQAFAARARVLIVNTQRVPEAEMPRSIFDILQPKWKAQWAMAKPQFGTTATQFCCWHEVLGPTEFDRLLAEMAANQPQLVPGNKQVALGVAEGKYAFGLTDSDDALIELEKKAPVRIVLLDAKGHPAHPRLGTILIPNTLAIIEKAPNPAGAVSMRDHLLSATLEEQLATSGAYQLPLRNGAAVPERWQMLGIASAKRMEVNFEHAATLWEITQEKLRKVFP